TAPPRGMKDLLPAEVELRDQAAATILATYKRYGFRRVETPALENLKLLLGSGGGANEKLIYKVLKRGANLDAVTMRRDEGLADDRPVPSAMASRCGVDAARHGEFFITLDKLDKIGRDGVERELREAGYDEGAIGKLFELFLSADDGSADGRLERLARVIPAA